MATSAEILLGMQNTQLFGAKLNRNDHDDRDAGNNELVKIISYQFDGTEQPGDFTSYNRTGWTDFSAAEKVLIRQAMDEMETFLNVKFEEVVGDDDPDLNLGKVEIPGATEGGFGIEVTVESVDIDDDESVEELETQVTSFDASALFDNTLDFAASYARVLQVLGHVMGLKSSFIGPVVPDGFDSQRYTVMSNQVDPITGNLADSFQPFDILALQDLWGPKVSGNLGDTSYDGTSIDSIQVILDGGGTDIIDASAQIESVFINLNEGATSTIDGDHDLIISFGSIIENATGGSGNDGILGNDEANILLGGLGADLLSGADGKDDLRGGNGADTLSGGDKNDSLRGGNGSDTLNGDNGNDILRGNKGADHLFGGDKADVLRGGDGDDILDGGAGKDKLRGGDGVDTFVFTEKFGKDTIKDFEDDVDILNIVREDVTTADDALDFATDMGGNVVFSFDDGSTITVEGMTIADLTDDISIA